MKKNILIVDDNEGDVRLIQEMLTQTKVEGNYQTALSGEDGVEKAKEFDPDIILLDTIMPGLDGFETCQKIKELGGKAKIIIITGQLQAYDEKKSIEAGADGYCLKLAEPLVSCILKFCSENDSHK